MKKILMIASAAAMAITMPALAQGQGKGKGASAKQSQSQSMKRNARSNGQVRADVGARVDVRARTNARANVRARTHTGASIDRLDINRDGRLDTLDRRLDRNRDGLNDRLCPPGLAKKTPACVPPGQAKRMFSEGQRIPTTFRGLTDFDDLSPQFRSRLPGEFQSDNFDFIVRDNSIFVVDPTTRVVRTIIDLLR